MSKGIAVSHLLNSKVYCIDFDFDDWPSTHFNDEKCIRGYDGSFFQLRYKYKELFPEDRFREIEEIKEYGEKSQLDVTQIKQIKYSVNFLTQTGLYIMEIHSHGNKPKKLFFNEEVSIMDICTNTEDLEIFDTEVI
jgi:hypothetical protein